MKSIHQAFALLLLAALPFVACKDDEPPLVIPTDGLVAHYPFDGNLEDMTDNRNHGIVEGITVPPQFITDRKGKNSNAVFLNKAVEIPNSDVINFQDNQNFTISIWLNYGDQEDLNDSINYVLIKGQPSNTNPFSLRVHNRNSKVSGIVSASRDDPNCSTIPSVVSSESKILGDNSWHNIVFIHENNLLKLFIDGVIQNSVPQSILCNVQNKLPLRVGKGQNGPKAWRYKGAADDLRIYNRALTVSEIEALAAE